MSTTSDTPRVMVVVPQYPYPVVGGLERQAHELAKALIEAGVELQVISGVVGGGRAGDETVEGVPVHRLPWPRKKILRFLRTPFDLFRVLYAKRNTYDVIHLHQHSWFGLYTIICAKCLRKPILTKLPSAGTQGVSALRNEPFGRLKLAMLLRSDALVSMSEMSHSELEAAGFPAERTLATPNGIRLGPPESRTGPGHRQGDICRVVFVGRLSEVKSLDTLLHGWREAMLASEKTAVLELWGTGPLDGELQQLSRKLGIADSVIFRGHVEGVRDRLPEMDIFVLPSRIEGNSNAVLEAMAAGLPIVSTHVGGTPMQVGPEGADFLCRPGDIETLAAKLGQLIGDPDLRARLGNAMRERVATWFDIRLVARTYMRAYRCLAERQRDLVSRQGNPVVAAGAGGWLQQHGTGAVSQ